MFNEFFEQYFLQPIRVESGYNLVNTTVYAISALLIIYGVYWLLNKIKFKIDIKFFLAMVPFIFLGSSIRAFVDNRYLARSFWIISPGIWITIATIFFSIFLVCYFIDTKTKFPYWKSCIIIGVAMLASAYYSLFSRITLTNFIGAVTILAIFSAAIVSLYSFGKTFRLEWITDKIHLLAISAHLFDATNTFIIVDFFGGIEKHPVPRFFIEHFGTGLIFYPLKLLVLLPAVYLIFTELKGNEQLRNFLLISIAVLGFAEGLRNFISLVLI